MNDRVVWFVSIIVAALFIVFGSTLVSYNHGYAKAVEEVIKSCLQDNVFVDRGLIIRCETIHNKKVML